MSGSLRKPPGRRQMNPLAIAIIGAGIGASATIFAPVISHLFELQSKECDRPNSRLNNIENVVETVPKLRMLRVFIASGADKRCECYGEAIAEARALEKEIADNEDAARRDRSKAADLQLRYDPTLDTGRSEPPQIRAAPPAPIVPPPPTSSPILNTQASIPVVSPSDGKVPSEETIRDFTALGESPPLVVTRNPIFSDPSKPFEGEVGDRLALKRNFSYELLPPQDTTTTYRIVRGTLTVDLNGQPYLSCKRGNEFRLYWKNAADFWTHTKDQKAELTVVDQQAGKHLGISACEDALG